MEASTKSESLSSESQNKERSHTPSRLSIQTRDRLDVLSTPKNSAPNRQSICSVSKNATTPNRLRPSSIEVDKEDCSSDLKPQETEDKRASMLTLIFIFKYNFYVFGLRAV